MKLNEITYAGHSAVFFHTDSLVAAIDPWLEGNPACPASLKHPSRLDLIVLTHGHSDHASEAPHLARHLGSTIAATWELANIMGAEGVNQNQIIAMNKGGTVEHRGIDITLTHAYHSSSFDTASGPVYAGEPCGAVLRFDNTVVYHAGDTALFSDMSLIAESYHPSVAFLPIGDRFTMGPREAARAAKLAGVKVAIPVHYGTFNLLTGTAEEFKAECARYNIEVAVLEPGQSYKVK